MLTSCRTGNTWARNSDSRAQCGKEQGTVPWGQKQTRDSSLLFWVGLGKDPSECRGAGDCVSWIFRASEACTEPSRTPSHWENTASVLSTVLAPMAPKEKGDVLPSYLSSPPLVLTCCHWEYLSVEMNVFEALHSHIKGHPKLGMVVPVCNPNTCEAKAGELLWVQGQPRQATKTLSQNNTKQKGVQNKYSSLYLLSS